MKLSTLNSSENFHEIKSSKKAQNKIIPKKNTENQPENQSSQTYSIESKKALWKLSKSPLDQTQPIVNSKNSSNTKGSR